MHTPVSLYGSREFPGANKDVFRSILQDAALEVGWQQKPRWIGTYASCLAAASAL
jgi:hypothetical protein